MFARRETHDYNIVEDLNEIRANISIYYLTNIVGQCELIVQAFSQPLPGDKAYSSQKVSGKSSGPLKYIVNVVTLEANTLFPPFLLTFENYNYNFHNFLFDFGASMNIMPLSVAKKIYAKWDKTDAKIIQLDKSLVQAMGELKNVLIR